MEQNNQLLEGYPEKEKVAYIGTIASLAMADLQASDEEIEFLDTLAESAGLADNDARQIADHARNGKLDTLKNNLDELKNSDLRFSLVADLMAFAKADGKFTADEEQRIRQMADYLNISDSQYSALNEFVNAASQGGIPNAQDNPANYVNSFAHNSTDRIKGFGQTMKESGIPMDSLMKGLLGVLAPMVISQVLSGRARRTSHAPAQGGGLLGQILNGGMNQNRGGSFPGGMGGGGLGSLIHILNGNRGYKRTGSVLDNILGGSGRGGFGF